jgi:hypothetical protein
MGPNTWTTCVNNGAATITCLEPLFQNIIIALISLSGVALFLMLIMGGYNFLFSGGDQKKLEKARGTITSAIMGMVVLVCAYLVLKAIGEFTGVGSTITNFQINVTP